MIEGVTDLWSIRKKGVSVGKLITYAEKKAESGEKAGEDVPLNKWRLACQDDS